MIYNYQSWKGKNNDQRRRTKKQKPAVVELNGGEVRDACACPGWYACSARAVQGVKLTKTW